MLLLKNKSLSQIKIFWHIQFWLFYLKTVIQRIGPCLPPRLSQQNQFIDYYCKINDVCNESGTSTIGDISLLSKSLYTYDFYRILANFPKSLRFNYLWGDITYVPNSPTFLKSRPIHGDNANSILLPLVTHRHLRFINDLIPYEDKKSIAVWRGAAYQKNRQQFLDFTKNLPFCDVANTSRDALKESPGNYLSIEEQFKYKIIFSIEGNDVATNLKWIMGSNSLCFTPPLIYETWFREGSLIPGIHYVEIKSDFTDIEEKFNYYINHPEEAKKIIKNAQAYVAQFKNIAHQYKLAEQVAHKYFQLTNQL